MTRERRPCACRGSLEADPKDPVDVERAVRSHQREPIHAHWRAREQLAGNLVAPERVAVGAPLPALHGRQRSTEPLELTQLVRRVA